MFICFFVWFYFSLSKGNQSNEQTGDWAGMRNIHISSIDQADLLKLKHFYILFINLRTKYRKKNIKWKASFDQTSFLLSASHMCLVSAGKS